MHDFYLSVTRSASKSTESLKFLERGIHVTAPARHVWPSLGRMGSSGHRSRYGTAGAAPIRAPARSCITRVGNLLPRRLYFDTQTHLRIRNYVMRTGLFCAYALVSLDHPRV